MTKIISKPPTKQYWDNYDRIFGNKKEKETTTQNIGQNKRLTELNESFEKVVELIK